MQYTGVVVVVAVVVVVVVVVLVVAVVTMCYCSCSYTDAATVEVPLTDCGDAASVIQSIHKHSNHCECLQQRYYGIFSFVSSMVRC